MCCNEPENILVTFPDWGKNQLLKKYQITDPEAHSTDACFAEGIARRIFWFL